MKQCAEFTHNWPEGSTEVTKQVNLSHLFYLFGSSIIEKRYKGVTLPEKVSINTWMRYKTEPWVDIKPEAEVGALTLKKTDNWHTPSHCLFHHSPQSMETCCNTHYDIPRRLTWTLKQRWMSTKPRLEHEKEAFVSQIEVTLKESIH